MAGAVGRRFRPQVSGLRTTARRTSRGAPPGNARAAVRVTSTTVVGRLTSLKVSESVMLMLVRVSPSGLPSAMVAS